MLLTKSGEWWTQFAERDRQLCLWFNRALRQRYIRPLFATISRLGNGLFWYALLAALPLRYGDLGLQVALQMLFAGAVGVSIYKHIKSRVSRPRPFVAHPEIVRGAAPLDEQSFPSGHTLHAVSFTLIVVTQLPWLGWLLIPFTLLIALSRMVLGLHYPSDVMMGALIGLLLAITTLTLFGTADVGL